MKHIKRTSVLAVIAIMLLHVPALMAYQWDIEAPGLHYEWRIGEKPHIKNNNDILEDRMNNALVMHIGKNIAFVNNYIINISESGDITPILIDGEPYIPFMFAAGAVNAVVETDPETLDITAYRSVYTVRFRVGHDIITSHRLDTETIRLDRPVHTHNGEIILPLAAFCEAFGKVYHWDSRGLIFISDEDDIFDPAADGAQINEAIALFDRQMREPLQLYVSPEGDDNHDGSFERPFKTFAHAKEAVRQLISGDMDRDIEVVFREGEYELTGPLTFTHNDSGQNHHNVIYRNHPGEKALINGGRRIEGWTHYSGDIWVAQVDPNWPITTLFENGSRGYVARNPNHGEWYTYMADPDAADSNTFLFNEGSQPFIEDTSRLRVGLWAIECFEFLVRVVRYDWGNNRVQADHIPYGATTGTRYFLQGAMELLDAPGEFLFEEGFLYYIPRDGDPNNSYIEAPLYVNDLFRFVGTRENNPVKNITFEGLTLKIPPLIEICFIWKTPET